MQEKDIREKLNQELDTMAPDILNKILATPIEPVKSEKELFGKDKPLFKESNKRKIWVPIMTAVAACIVILIMVFSPFSLSPSYNNEKTVAFNIIIDVNPSITIEVNEDGTVKKLKAGNKDAKKIVKKINKKLDEDADYNKVVMKVVRQLNNSGYLAKKDNAMLVSVVSDDKDAGKEKLKEIKKQTENVEKKKKIKCISVYQVCEETEEVVEIAEKNNVSLGKATLCIKLAEKENVSVKKMCKKTIYELVETAEKSEYIAMDDEIILSEIAEMEEIESETLESESVSETESIEESTTLIAETSTVEGESESESYSEETTIIETTVPETPETIVNQ